jgi:hypothetical protein
MTQTEAGSASMRTQAMAMRQCGASRFVIPRRCNSIQRGIHFTALVTGADGIPGSRQEARRGMIDEDHVR